MEGGVTTDPIRRSAARLGSFASDVLTAAAVSEPDARGVAKSLVDADLRGIHSHGVSRLGINVERLCCGGNRASGAAPSLALLKRGVPARSGPERARRRDGDQKRQD